jgi:uncharacterized membrane protein (DUF4010 family)
MRMDLALLQQFGMALALSVLIGLEREQNKQNLGNESFAGVRTFTLIGLLGALVFYLVKISLVLSLVVASATFLLIIASYIAMAFKKGRIGLTTEIASVITFLVGGFCVYEYYIFAVALALVTLVTLYFKKPFHKWAKNLKRDEIISAIKFMMIAFIVLPLLPNQGYGPYGIFNPYLFWLVVVLVSGISFVSYILVRVVGLRRGIRVTGFLAGFISSTVLAFNFSKESKDHQSIVNPYVFAMIAANAAMCIRVLVEVFILNENLGEVMVVPVFAMIAVGVVAAVIFWFWKDSLRDKSEENKLKEVYKVKSPFRFLAALKFAILFAVVLFATKLAQVYFGHNGVYVAGAISGIIDMDAIAISMAKLSTAVSTVVSSGTAVVTVPTSASMGALSAVNTASSAVLGYKDAVTAIIMAATASMVFKSGLFIVFGAKKVALKVCVVSLCMISAGLVSLLFI